MRSPARYFVIAAAAVVAGFLGYKTTRLTAPVEPGPGPGLTLAPPESQEQGSRPKIPSDDEISALVQKENQALGIQAVIGPGDEDPTQKTPGLILNTPQGRVEATAYMRQLAAMQRAMGLTQPPTVPIDGKKPRLLATSDEGRVGKPVRPAALPPGKDWSGLYGGPNEAGTRTISDAAAWQALWKSLSTAPVPYVDFSRHCVVAVFLGQRPSGGYRVEIKDVSATELFVRVRYRETTPSPGMTPPEGATAPHVLRVIERTDLPVRFEEIK